MNQTMQFSAARPTDATMSLRFNGSGPSDTAIELEANKDKRVRPIVIGMDTSVVSSKGDSNVYSTDDTSIGK